VIAAVFALLTVAHAAEPELWARELVGTGGWPSGLLQDAKMQARFPGHRSKSILFQDTYTGIGGRVAVSPAFLEVGPRFSWAPIDVFDVDVQASWVGFAGPFAPISFDTIDVGRVESARNQRSGEGFPLSSLQLSVSPTLKAQVGPIVAFDTMTVTRIVAHQPDDVAAPFWYEPLRDMILAWEDTTIEHNGTLAVELLAPGDGPELMVGVAGRSRAAQVSKDRFANVGPSVVWRPGSSLRTPQIIAQALFYVQDPERVGGMPNLNLAATWVMHKPLREL